MTLGILRLHAQSHGANRRRFGIAALLSTAACSPSTDIARMNSREGAETTPPTVAVAFGWRVQEVERRSTAPVQFADRDVGALIIEEKPVALAYAEQAHPFTLPPGRFLRLNQAAGRLYDAKTTPHLEALTLAAATALVDSVARLLDGAAWTRVPDAGTGAAAVRAAAQFAVSGADGFGVTHVGTWRVPRPQAAWATLPPGTPQRPGVWDGVEALVTVQPVSAASNLDAARLIVEVALTDHMLSGELQEMVELRRRRYNGEMQTRSSWDARPGEPLTPTP